MPAFADLALVNGTVITMDGARPRAEAVACLGGRIVAVGTQGEVRDWIDRRTEVVDLDGRVAVPGLIDAHNHMLMFGQVLTQVNLTTARGFADIARALRPRTEQEQPGAWIDAWGYDHNRMHEGRHPTRIELDAAAPDHPVLAVHTSGHVLVANSAALRAAGVTGATPDPGGGQIDRDVHGEPTGVLRENAMQLVRRVRPRPERGALARGLQAANAVYLREGITAQCDLGTPELSAAEEWGAWQEAWERDWLSVRTRLYACYRRDGDAGPAPPPLLATGIRSGFGDERLKLGGLKFYLDGGIGSATAAMYDPYPDDSGNRGILMYDQDTINGLLDEAHRLGYQIAIHAIGDRAVAMAVEAIGRALAQLPAPHHRHRIEHCVLTPPAMVARMRELGIIPVPQPHFFSHLGDAWRRAVGDARLRWAFPLRSWLQAGLVVPGGSDRPVVADGSPLRGMADAVLRTTAAGSVMSAQERITAAEALRMFTLHAAYAAGEERWLGSVAVGKRADLTVLSADPTRVEPEAIGAIGVEMTVLNGAVAYARP